MEQSIFDRQLPDWRGRKPPKQEAPTTEEQWATVFNFLDIRMKIDKELEGKLLADARKEVALAQAGKEYQADLIPPTVLKMITALEPMPVDPTNLDG